MSLEQNYMFETVTVIFIRFLFYPDFIWCINLYVGHFATFTHHSVMSNTKFFCLH